jgi:hypothetical protein
MRYLTAATRAVRMVGVTGARLLVAIGQHHCLTIPLCSRLLDLHPTSVGESLRRLERRGLVYPIRSNHVPSEAARWYLTSQGCRCARLLGDDPAWDPRRVIRSMRRATADAHDLAIAEIRIVIFRRHKWEWVVQRARRYVRNRQLLDLDRTYRLALSEHDQAWAAGMGGAPPREPEQRLLARRAMGLGLRQPLPLEDAVLIPDLYLPASIGGPVIIEMEMGQATGAHLATKIRHLATYQASNPNTFIIVVYPPGAHVSALALTWRRAIQRNPDPLAVCLTSLDELRRAADGLPDGLSVATGLPGVFLHDQRRDHP